MNRDDINRMAREARLSNGCGKFGYPYLPELERFAELVAAAEREAIAEMVSNCNQRATPKGIAAAIRVRGEQ